MPGDEAFDLSVHPDVARHTLEEMAPSMVNPRERCIFEARILSEPSVSEELATRFGISRERVRQIEIRAFEKVQATVCARQANKAARRHGQTEARK